MFLKFQIGSVVDTITIHGGDIWPISTQQFFHVDAFVTS